MTTPPVPVLGESFAALLDIVRGDTAELWTTRLREVGERPSHQAVAAAIAFADRLVGHIGRAGDLARSDPACPHIVAEMATALAGVRTALAWLRAERDRLTALER